MKKLLGVIVVGLGLVALAGVATAQWRMGPGAGGFGGMGPGMMGYRGSRGGPGPGAGYGCPGYEATTAQITEDKAKELAQQYADQYLKGFTVERVLPFTGMRHSMYAVELKNQQGELRTLRINPFGNVMPFGGPWSRG
ncbi:MAG: hypothetical protein HYY46_11685 [Deltaproteobacteria bacterium]|nr:hypothetical protein [Deltaproteobacteria bacterium]